MQRIILLLFCIPTYLFAQNLTRTEQKIIEAVSLNNAEALTFLEKIVNINSGTLNLEGVKEVGQVLGNEFQKIGMQTKWIPLPEEMNRAGHLFAENHSHQGKRILLIGHLDTVFEKDSPLQKFEKINETTAKAPGGNDMKGGDVIILYALKALKEADVLKDLHITVAFTGDEESTGKPLEISRKDLKEAAMNSDIALGFETGTGFDNATVARRGASGWELKVSGKRAHSAGVFGPNAGAGAIYETSRILHEFYEALHTEKYLTFNPGVILGGTEMTYDSKTASGTINGKTNIVAQQAYVNGDLRFIDEEQKERARAIMREIVAQHLPQTDAEITFTDSYPAMSPVLRNYQVLEVLNKLSQDMGHGSVNAYDPAKRGAGDVSFVAEYVACLDGLGALGSGAHSNDETVDLSTFEAITQRAALLIYRLSKSE